MTLRGRVTLVVGVLLTIAASAYASPAHAATRVYWANFGDSTLAFSDGTGGAKLAITGATPATPSGVAIDPVAGKIYWGNRGGCPSHGIEFANLDGSGGGSINTTGATCSEPASVALDRSAGRIYWGNFGGGAGTKISYANLDGSGGHDVNISTATDVNGPFGIIVDPAAGRLYWSNWGNSTIAFANIDGSGSGPVNTMGAHVVGPTGLALDTAAHRLYWANFNDNTISYASLGGGTNGQLNITGTSAVSPEGVAIDVAGGRIYWGNRDNGTISFANLNNSGGGGTLTTSPGTANGPVFPALLKSPTGTGAPTASGGNVFGSTLSCNTGSWAVDELPAVLYQAPQSFSFQWLLNGAPIAGANGSSFTTTTGGSYQCVVTASNAAGSGSQTSGPVNVIGDSDHDGVLDNADKCPNTPAGRFDANHDGCPGPYAALHISAVGSWTVSNRGVRLASMSVHGLRKGVKVKLVCKSCHIKQTLTAKGSVLGLKKLKGKLLKRGKGFSLTVTGTGLIGDQLTVTVKNYGHNRAAFVKESRAPFRTKHRCLPVGSSKTAKACSATPPTGP